MDGFCVPSVFGHILKWGFDKFGFETGFSESEDDFFDHFDIWLFGKNKKFCSIKNWGKRKCSKLINKI